jgi:hypothetical protein
MPEKAGLGEQALNKIAETALASQLEEVERLEVQIKTNLSKLARGEVDSIAIEITGLLTHYNLRVEELQLQINRVTVKPLSAVFGKVILTQPSTGVIRFVLTEDNLTSAFNSKSFLEHLHQTPSLLENERSAIHFQQVKCYLLADGNIAFNSNLIFARREARTLAFTTTPRINFDRQRIDLQDIHYKEGQELPPELTVALVTQVSEVLNLISNFERKGMSLRIQQLDVATGKLTLQAATYIEQFPSS